MKIALSLFLIICYSMKRFLILALLLLSFSSFSKGIIIGKSAIIQNLFHDSDSLSIIKTANNISKKYDKVIIHLGRKDPFAYNGLFNTTVSQNNLRTFSDFLKNKDVKIYFWILDSYGSKSFKKLYKQHEEIIDNFLLSIDTIKIYCDGYVVDMEWINIPYGKNNKRYLKILKYFKSKIGDKKLFPFISIIEIPEHNSERGFDEKEILKYADNILPMLYVADAGFHIKNTKLQPKLFTDRINSLKNYFNNENYNTVVSMCKGIICVNHNKATFEKTIYSIKDPIFTKLKKGKTEHYPYYNIVKYKAKETFSFKNDNDELIKIKKRNYIYFIDIKESIIAKNDFIWEYSYIEIGKPNREL